MGLRVPIGLLLLVVHLSVVQEERDSRLVLKGRYYSSVRTRLMLLNFALLYEQITVQHLAETLRYKNTNIAGLS